MLSRRRPSWFPGLRDSVSDFRAVTTAFRVTSIIILTDIIGTHTCTTIRTREIHIHIIPRLPDPCGTAGIGPTAIIATTITTATNEAGRVCGQRSYSSRRLRKKFCKMPAHSSCNRPNIISHLWLNPGICKRFTTLPAAPATGSAQPKITRRIRV